MAEQELPRPLLERTLSGRELRRWYWLKDELICFARLLGVRSHGSKEVLTDRIAAHLDGVPFPESTAKLPAARCQLGPQLTTASVIPIGQRCSQNVRQFFTEQIGPAFRFDAAMRHFFAATDGTQTLGDAIDHWQSTRGSRNMAIDRQFEFNRFTRTWHAEHPQSPRSELLAAWATYRASSVDMRGRV
ncbi:hypothetical protein EH165_14340 [Nakamurella antarctica]|uniref:DUF6434 domain-containing protein n=1 Tax=Nakamurella antarctica TaxID=1902245 RepID=A0A3G8ZQR4_9ACTN|nr:DUF6434 domain-containing protein [Nakamurella antarctica]AZI59145.1 hypothetical protein EH165_14340 [Nakamurella antarctica]